MNAADDPSFGAFVQCMTDGVAQYLWAGYTLDDGSGFAGGRSEALRGRSDTSPPDLAGARVLYLRLNVIQSDVQPNGELFQMDVRYLWEVYGYRPSL